MRAAIYARYSSDNQSEASIADQVRRCRRLIQQNGWTEIQIFSDHAISGATNHRPEFLALEAEVNAGRLDVVVAEGLDRISRDQEHIARFYKDADFTATKIITCAEGEVTPLHIGFNGTMNAMALKDLGQKTHRGLEGRVLKGKSAGGLCFGYRVKRELKSDGTLSTGDREIDAAEAAIIRRVFSLYVNGTSPKKIARILGDEGILGSLGGRWTASLILGNAERETGILRNRLYIGQLVWNRQKFRKVPKTGKRISRPNPRDEWLVKEIPELRIIDDELWQAAQTRLAMLRDKVLGSTCGGVSARSNGGVDEQLNKGALLGRARRPAWLLSGLIRCGLCNGLVTGLGKDRLGCATHQVHNRCTNNRTILRALLLRRVLDAVKHRLLTSEAVQEFMINYTAEVAAANKQQGARTAKLRSEQARVLKQIKSLTDAIKNAGWSQSLLEELHVLEHRQDELKAALLREAELEPAFEMHPNLPALYRRRVEALEQALEEPDAEAAAVAALRTLIDSVLFYPEPGRGQHRLELRGDLAAFMWISDPDAADEHNRKARARSGTGLACFDVGSSLVAGPGFEPGTFRL